MLKFTDNNKHIQKEEKTAGGNFFKLRKTQSKQPVTNMKGSKTTEHNQKIQTQNVSFTEKLLSQKIEYEESPHSSIGSTPGSNSSPNWLIACNIDLGKAGVFVLHGLHKEDPDEIAQRFSKEHNLGPRS